MSTELVNGEALATAEDTAPLNLFAMQQEAYGDASEVAGSRTGMLPYVTLMGGSSDKVKTGACKVAHFYLSVGKGEDDLKELGKSFPAIILAWRPKATDMNKPVRNFYKPSSPEFQEIRKIAEKGGKTKCVFGPELLLWTENYGFVAYYLSSETARNTFQSFSLGLPSKDGVLKVTNIGNELIDNGEHKWHGPTAKISDIKIGPPPRAEMLETVKLFLSPIDSKPQPKLEAAPADTQLENR